MLDGWWGEGYNGKNGWAIKPAPEQLEEYRRNQEESQSLYEILEDKVVPLYYDRGKFGYSESWVKIAKNSIASLLPRFNATRMVGEYLARFYLPATKQGRRYSEDHFQPAIRVARWKTRIREAWSAVRARRLDAPVKRIDFGTSVQLEVAVYLNGLKPDDVMVELLMGRPIRAREPKLQQYRFSFTGILDASGAHVFALELAPELCGRLEYQIRVFPWHELLTHPLEMGLMIWL